MVVVEGRSEARLERRGSGGQGVVGGRGIEGEEGAGGREDCKGEHSDGGGIKENGRGDDGERDPASSLSISLSNFTSPGGSIPYLAPILPSSIRQRHTSRGCLWRTKPSDSKR